MAQMGVAPPAQRAVAFHKLAWTVFFGLVLCAWVIYLSGVAASQQACVDLGTITRRMLLQQEEDPLNLVGGRRSLAEADWFDQAPMHGRQLLASMSERCGNRLSFAWWTVWFYVVVIGVAIMSALLGGAHQNVALIFMTIETTILMFVAYDLNTEIFGLRDARGSKAKDLRAAYRCAMAGNVMLMIFNLIYLVATTESTASFMPVLGGAQPLPAAPEFGKPADVEADAAPPMTALPTTTTTAHAPPREVSSGGSADPTLAPPPAYSPHETSAPAAPSAPATSTNQG